MPTETLTISIEPTARGGARRVWGPTLVRVAGSLLVLALLVAFVSPADLAAAARHLTPKLLLPALAIYLLLHLLGTVKWRLMVNAADGRLPLVQAARCYYLGLFANTFLVSLVGGDVVRAGVALRHVHSKTGLIVGSLADRLLDVLGLTLIAAVAALSVPSYAGPHRQALVRFLLVGAVGGVVAVGVLWLVLPPRRLPYKARRRLVQVRRAIREVARRPGRILTAMGLGIVLQCSLVVLNAWLGEACGLHLPLWVWLFAWPLAKIVSMLPVSLGGLGVREAALVGLMAPFGAPAAAIVAAGLAFEAVIIVGGLAGGLIALLLTLSTAEGRTRVGAS